MDTMKEEVCPNGRNNARHNVKQLEVKIPQREYSSSPSALIVGDGSGGESNGSSNGKALKSKLNAQAPEFVPRSPLMVSPHPQCTSPRPLFLTPPSPLMSSFNFYGELDHHSFDVGDFPSPSSHALSPHPSPSNKRNSLTDDLTNKIARQVEYYFGDASLSTNNYLLKLVSKDPQGFVPISFIASFKKVKSLVSNYATVSAALKTSTQLVVSEDGKRVRRKTPLSDAAIEEIQSRMIIAENLPEDINNEKIEKTFSAVGKVKSVRICQPHALDNQSPFGARSPRTNMLVSNKLHAIVEFQSTEQADKAVTELNDERNWRSGLRVRLLRKRTPRSSSSSKGRKSGTESPDDTDEQASTVEPLNKKQYPDLSQAFKKQEENVSDEQCSGEKEAGKKCYGRGKGNVRGRSLFYNGYTQPIGCSTYPTDAHIKHPPGPRMPDGTKGFTLGRGKPLQSVTVCPT